MKIGYRLKKIICFIAIATAALGMPLYAFCQSAAERSVTAEEKRLKRDAPEKAVPEEIVPSIKKEEIKKEELPPEADKEFFVERIIVEGNTILTNEEISKITKPHEDTQITLRKLILLADEITGLYQAKGYITSQAYVPPQKVKDKTIRINVFEGKIGKVKIERNKHFKSKIFAKGLKRFENEILDYNDLYKELIYLNKNPDVEVSTVLVPGEKTGESDLVAKVKDKLPIHAQYEINNYGTVYTGRRRHGLAIYHNNLIGQNDKLFTKFFISDYGDSMNAYLLNYELPLPFQYENRSKLNVFLSYSEIDLIKEFANNEIEGHAFTGSVSFGQEFFNNIRFRAYYDVGIEAKHSVTDSRTGRLYTDNLRSGKISMIIEEVDGQGRMTISNEIKGGLPDFLGSSSKRDPDVSSDGAGGNFVKYSLRATRINRFIMSSSLLLNFEMQVTPDKLVNA
jgi:hemolysin activation/secretion protein